ncbi:uncharacterized protein RHOBADRAFT_42026 [Rhodotorula graminis WP1]|uniref:DUF6534 domain-containing protein n=1 Tax=Rhodotorula graminis (strain WP1) TaxID=578459 RepID=A0A194SBN3_RHOGW|nr:uncharacterized protein RHOBADRAFT_42026 [Rhodotorula graminis WP1]KPV76816.1 hypothetical protein RHOBADRAFT_42026 [Rhodotorula graminis WP1]
MDDYDVMGPLAPQDIATAVLAPYLTGLVVQLLLSGLYFGLFLSSRRELGQHARKVKAVSWIVCALVLCCVGMACEEMVDTGVSQDRDTNTLFAGPPQSNVLPILGGLTGAVCQAFLMVRAAALFQSRTVRLIFYVVTSAAILLPLAGAALFSAMGFLITQGKRAPLEYFTAEAIWLWSSAAADLLISLALAHTLHRRIAGFNARTDGVLWRLIIVALQTAAYTSVVSIVGAAVATALEKSSNILTSTAAFAFWLPLPALHAISLYTTLSSRRHVQTQLNASFLTTGGAANDGLTLPFSVVSGAAGAPPPRSGARSAAGGGGRAPVPVHLAVKVEREEEVSYDDGLELELDMERRGRRGSRFAAPGGEGTTTQSSLEKV